MKMIQDGVDVYCLPDNAYCEKDEEQYLTEQKIMGFPVYSQMPEGWKIDFGATTAPKGYVIISNCESRFGGKRKTGIIKH